MTIEEQKQIEDYEKSLAINVSILLKALKDGFWYKAVNGKIFHMPYDTVCIGWYINDNEYEAIANDSTIYHTEKVTLCYDFIFEEYGKTWALTKEELQKETNNE